MRPGSFGLLALLWPNIAIASPLADSKPMPGLRPRQGTGGTGAATPAATTTTPTTTTPATTAAVETTPITTAAADPTTTVTVTTTQGGGAGGTVTVSSTLFRTVVTTIVVTTTSFETTTVTSSDVATATVTNYVTSTVLAKRSLNVLPAENAPRNVPAQATPAAGELRKHAVIEKRAVVTVTVTVSGTAAADVTVTNVRTSTVVRTTTSNLVRTSTITSVQYNNAETTVTVTSTLVVTSTSIETSAPTTVEVGPTGSGVQTATETSGSSSTGSADSGSSDSGGLSTGAKAGIGAAVGVVGLAALLGLGWWVYRRRKANRPSAADLADMRAYDPNGPSLNNDMRESGVGGTPTQRRDPPLRKSSQLSPPTQSVSPMSNQSVSPAATGHASPYARPPAGGATELGGTRILPAEMGGDEVAEMGDGQPKPRTPPPRGPRPGAAFQSGPVSDVYEMPTEKYR
ncbi:hypothetical protein Cob_v011817 [Colletotrichum orbiculare MAFF 240422]|uniref:Uncharacterized protein n=1 Tax=Colletotrichum orbiculare (strain 104-T / ATCC 96160 / CBS 514.97 / LARS 414 / MAFF 240422) TaxID=1213857 RepID=N4V796_COLOR|nr:hypothetical protein Cob_v011817 [Colletotrichum orbiculare MAFF 240422]